VHKSDFTCIKSADKERFKTRPKQEFSTEPNSFQTESKFFKKPNQNKKIYSAHPLLAPHSAQGSITP